MKFRFFRLPQLLFLIITLSTAATVFAANPKPLSKEMTKFAQIRLAEVKGYYGRQGVVSGPVGVVVELEDTPAALVYAQGSKTLNSVSGSNQLNVIRQKQGNLMTAIQSKGVQATEIFRAQKAYNGIWMRLDMKDLNKVANLPGVKALHPIIPKKPHHTTSVPLIGALQAWGGSGSYQGTDIKIGIIDTGIDYDHTNFGGNGDGSTTFPTAKVVGGYDFVGDAYTGSNTPRPDTDPMDCYGHGSHVAGSAAGFGVKADGTTYHESGADTYAALKNLSSTDYMSKFRIGPGVAPKADLYSLRVFGCDGDTSVVTQAIEWAMDPNGDDNTADHLDVINMSLGSDFGSPFDVDSVAADNAAKAGVIVVASAGNSGDVNYITGSPAAANYAISVASSVNPGGIGGAFEVTATTVPSPTMPVGLYSAVESGFNPSETFSQPGVLAYASPADGCSIITGVSGKIALIDRGTCNFTVKVKNAQTAGALGVLIANNQNTLPFAMGGTDATILVPSMMTSKAIGDNLKTDLAKAGSVTVLLTSAHRNTMAMSEPGIEDNVSSFSSRGITRNGGLLKPDIAAPGDTIFSTESGSGNQGTSMSGTSMASPHVTGVMALLKQIHPTWSVAGLKALAMNTATNDLFVGLNKTGDKYTPSRIGAGRVNVANAAASEVLAYNASNPELVSVAFGAKEVLTGTTENFVKSITINNLGATDAEYNVAFDSRYQTNPGLTFSLLNAAGVALSNPVTVPAKSTLEIKVQAAVNASLLLRALDPTLATTGDDIDRERFSEGGGYVSFTSTGSNPLLRVPVHIAARPASAMKVSNTEIVLPDATTGTFQLTPTGTAVATSDDDSIVTILELMGTSPKDAVWSSDFTHEADLKYIGAASDYPSETFANAQMFFGIATYGKWDTPSAVEFDVYIDTNEDDIADYVVFNTNMGFYTGTTDDMMLSTVCNLSTSVCDAYNYVNELGGSTNTNLFNNNVMVLPVPFSKIGLVQGSNTKFNFQVVSFSNNASGPVDISTVMTYDVAKQAFKQDVSPINYDVSGSNFDIAYDKTAIASNNSKGLLLLHHHNLSDSSAEVVPNVVGVCGSSNGSPFTSKPATNLCSVGTPSEVSGTGPWTWNCSEITTSSCSAYLRGTVVLPKTGQTKCYDATGATVNEIACAGTGQDGEKQMGAAQSDPLFRDNSDGTITDKVYDMTWQKDAATNGATVKHGIGVPAIRFSDNDNGTITDNLTGLVWLKDLTCFSALQNWGTALYYANTLKSGDCSLSDGSTVGDWRLPNIDELASVATNWTGTNIAAWFNNAAQGFINVQANGYWSSTTQAIDMSTARLISMIDGSSGSVMKLSSGHVWPVRAGQSGSLGTLAISKSGTGSGSIRSDISGISCGATCSASFPKGESVLLTATPDAGNSFTSWTGCSSTDGNKCTVSTVGAKSVTAAFTLLPTYTVTFNKNGGSGSMSPQTTYAATNLTTNTFTRTGYTFAGWNTNSGGTGTSYADGANYPFNANATLYAQWSANTYVITFNSNGGSDVSNMNVTYDKTATAPTEPAKTGYSFAGWYSNSGLTTSFSFSDPITITANTTLYAKWTRTYTVTYNTNGATTGTAPGDQAKIQGINLILAANSGNLVKTWYTFAGWNTAANGTGTNYAAGATYSGNTALTLYAKWTPTDTTGPNLTVSTLDNGAKTNNATLNVAGTVSDSESGVKSLTINGTPATITSGSFTVAITLADGANTITTIATNNSGVTTTDTRTITLDQTAPVLAITLPSDNSVTDKTFVEIIGYDNDVTANVTAKVNNGTATGVTMSGIDFNVTLNLTSGLNTIDITATDPAGNSSSVKRTITSDSTIPTLAVTVPAQDITTTQGSMTIRGTVTDITTSTISITVDDQLFTPTVTSGSFSQNITLATEKTYNVVVTATDQAGNKATVQRNIIKNSATASGDINGDGIVDIADALIVLRIAVGLETAKAADYATADVAPLKDGKPNPDGIIDIADATVILMKVAGLRNW